jgi:N-methylhydantoinase B
MELIGTEYVKCSICGKLVFGVRAQDAAGDVRCGDELCQALARSGGVVEELNPGATFGTRRLPALSASVDPVRLEVISGGLTSVCQEMGITMSRTAYSPIFFEGHDFTCAIFDEDVDLVAQYEGNPAQLGAMKWAVRWAVEDIGRADLRPGDVLLHNDSYRGSPHPPEFCMIRPLFVEGRLVGFAANIAHHTDVGGMAPGSMPGDATEIWQEGVIIPPVKFFERDEEVALAWRILLSNVRQPEAMRGDMLAQYGSMVTCERRIQELAGRFGLETMLEYFAHIKDRTELRVRAEIAKWANGVYEGISYLDDDGVTAAPIAIRTKLHVWDEDLIIDLRGSDSQGLGPVNAPYGVTASAVLNAILNVMDPSIPRNEGVFKPLHILTRPGSIVNVNYPAPLNAGNTESHNLIVASVMAALAHVVPDRVAADDGGTTSLLSGGAIDPRTRRPFSFLIWEPCGAGARASLDGNNAMITYCGSTSTTYSCEVLEASYPVLVTGYRLVDDSCGAGKTRGGLGMAKTYQFRVPRMAIGINANRNICPPQGRFGGRQGGVTQFLINHNGLVQSLKEYANLVSPTKGSRIVIFAGQEITVQSPGGGGYGPPTERDEEMVKADLREGYISRDTAINVYGLAPKEADEIISRYWYHPKGH